MSIIKQASRRLIHSLTLFPGRGIWKRLLATLLAINGSIYTHGIAHFDGIYDTTVTNGVIANEGIAIGEIWSTKTFNYADTTIDEIVPAGFEGLLGGGGFRVCGRPDAWKAI